MVARCSCRGIGATAGHSTHERVQKFDGGVFGVVGRLALSLVLCGLSQHCAERFVVWLDVIWRLRVGMQALALFRCGLSEH